MKEYSKNLKQKVKKNHTTTKKQKLTASAVQKIKSLKKIKLIDYTRRSCNYTVSFCRRIYAKTYNLFNAYGTKLGKIGIKAHWISWIGFGIGIFAINFLALEMYGWALAAILLNRACDGLDGAVARSTKITNFGVFLDATLDYIFYGGVIWGFALANGNNAPSACFLMFGFTAEWESGEISKQDDEIADAQWFSPDDCPATPSPGSIAYLLIEDAKKKQKSV